MSVPTLYDAVTLINLAAVGMLPVLSQIHESRPEPRWTEAVHDEVHRGQGFNPANREVLAEVWLGSPAEVVDLATVFRVQAALKKPGEAGTKHMGESESIALAKALGGTFYTDDTDAFELARNEIWLGAGRVFEGCWALMEAVEDRLISQQDRDEAHIALMRAQRSFLCQNANRSCP